MSTYFGGLNAGILGARSNTSFLCSLGTRRITWNTIDLTDPFGDNSLYSKFKLDGDALDSIGDFDGSLAGDISFVDSETGTGATCTSPDTSPDTDRISIDKSILDKDRFSIFLSFNANSINTDYINAILNNYDCSDSQVLVQVYVDPDKSIRACYWNRNTTDTVTTVKCSFEIETDRYYKVVFTVDKSNNTMKLFVDGVLADSITDAAINGSMTDNIKLFGWEANCTDANTISLDGVIDFVEFYDKVLDDRQAYDLCTQTQETLIQGDDLLYSKNPFFDNSLISKYGFNNNLDDFLEVYNAQGEGTINYEAGKFVSMYSATSNDDYIVYPDLGTFFEGRTEYSINIMAKPQTDDEGVAFTFMVSYETHEDPYYNVGFKLFIDRINLYTAEGGGDTDQTFYFDNTISEGQIITVCVTFNNGLYKIYIDGEYLGEYLSSVTSIPSCYPDAMSGRIPADNSSSNSCRVYIDQLEIYNRDLNVQEAKILYNQSNYVCNPTLSIPDLVCYYPYDGTGEDYLGNYDSTEQGSVEYEVHDMGLCAKMDGTSAYFLSDLTSNIVSNVVTVNMWLYLDYLDDDSDDGDSVVPFIISNDEGENDLMMFFHFVTDDILRIYTDNNFVEVDDIYFKEKEWFMFTMTSDGKIYKDGILIIDTGVQWSGADDGKIVFGADIDSDSVNNWVHGYMKNARVYNRVLSLEEIETIYNYEVIKPDLIDITRDLKIHYPMKKNSICHSAAGYDGTDYGTMTFEDGYASFNASEALIPSYEFFSDVLVNSDNDNATGDQTGKYNISAMVKAELDKEVLLYSTGMGGNGIGTGIKNNKAFFIIFDDDDYNIIESQDNIILDEFFLLSFNINLDDKELSIFSNGVLIAQDTFDYNLTDRYTACGIGGCNIGTSFYRLDDRDGDDNYGYGKIFDFRFYTRELSQDEMAKIYLNNK